MKSKIVYLCSACGDDFAKWNGQCPSCNEWGTLSEFKVSKNRKQSKKNISEPNDLDSILNIYPSKRIMTGLAEADRVLGGGMLSGSLILLGGNPGVGKSTLALHMCSGIGEKVLYISAEESEEQVALRARRLDLKSDDLFLSSENELDGILKHVDRTNPVLVIIDN